MLIFSPADSIYLNIISQRNSDQNCKIFSRTNLDFHIKLSFYHYNIRLENDFEFESIVKKYTMLYQCDQCLLANYFIVYNFTLDNMHGFRGRIKNIIFWFLLVFAHL